MESLHADKLASGGSRGPSTLRFVDVQEIRDGVILLKNGSLRLVLAVSSINFYLKSTEEQNALIAQYQNFLNSLDFPLQVLIASRKLNIKPYLDMLKQKEKEQTNELLRVQITEYQNFIVQLTQVSNIMTKKFYLIIPFFPVEASKANTFDSLFSFFNPEKVITHKREKFEMYKSQLYQRVDHVMAGLASTGLRIAALNTEEVVELLYNSYNPNLFAVNIVKNIESLEFE